MTETSASVPWWRDPVIYQVYVRSFADSDGDGIGDISGIVSRLDHLVELGVDAIWLNPFYPSPQVDAGYDVANYVDVDSRFGTLADADRLIAEAHGRGLRVIVDLVPNHTSSEHPWFQAALSAGPGSPERALYLFRDGRGPGGNEPPNDWQNNFGGSAWTRVVGPDGIPEQWYLHLFAPEQPDLDWTNQQVRTEFERILRFWLDRGVDGFRIDVAHGLAKDPAMPDLGETLHRASGPAQEGHPHYDQDEVHEVYRSWRRVTDSYPGERMFVGEIWLASPQRVARYLRPDELHTAFNFNLVLADWDCDQFRAAIDSTLTSMSEVGAPPTWVLSNHDVIRHVTRFGGGEMGLARARAGTLLILALPGGTYLYQAEELGLPEVLDLPPSARQDPTFFRTNGQDPGRDGCRVPIPWSGAEPSYGFGPGPASWLPQPPEWVTLSVAAQSGDPASTLTLYQAALRLRRTVPGFGDGPFEWLDTPPGMLAFRRAAGLVCLTNFTSEPMALPEWLGGAEALLSSSPLTGDELPAATTVWLGVSNAQ